jgi:hypothetical protein
MRRAVEMHHTFLIEPLFICRPGRQHWRSEFAFFAEYAMRHANVRILKNHRLSRLDRYRLWSERLHRFFLPNTGAIDNATSGPVPSEDDSEGSRFTVTVSRRSLPA